MLILKHHNLIFRMAGEICRNYNSFKEKLVLGESRAGRMEGLDSRTEGRFESRLCTMGETMFAHIISCSIR